MFCLLPIKKWRQGLGEGFSSLWTLSVFIQSIVFYQHIVPENLWVSCASSQCLSWASSAVWTVMEEQTSPLDKYLLCGNTLSFSIYWVSFKHPQGFKESLRTTFLFWFSCLGHIAHWSFICFQDRLRIWKQFIFPTQQIRGPFIFLYIILTSWNLPSLVHLSLDIIYHTQQSANWHCQLSARSSNSLGNVFWCSTASQNIVLYVFHHSINGLLSQSFECQPPSHTSNLKSSLPTVF